MRVMEPVAAAAVIHAGGIVAHPTEAVYGLGCDPGNEQALRRLLQLKHRPQGFGFILIAAACAVLVLILANPARDRQRA